MPKRSDNAKTSDQSRSKQRSDATAMPTAANRRDFLLGRSAAMEAERLAKQAVDRLAKGIASTDGPRQSGYLEQYCKSAMACEFEISFNLHQYPQASPAAMEAFDLIDRLEQQMTVYRDDSEVSLLNSNAVNNTLKVEPGLFRLLSIGQAIAIGTAGAFDMTAGHLSEVWGFERRQGKLPTQEMIEEALQLVGAENLILDASEMKVKLALDGVKINLGGIGKGFALDRVAMRFAELGIRDFILHGGQSSLLAFGSSDVEAVEDNEVTPLGDAVADPTQRNESQMDDSRKVAASFDDTTPGETTGIASSSGLMSSEPKKGWGIGVTHPNLPEVRLAELTLCDQALGTSGTARQGFYHRGKRYGHIIDPRTGWPASHFLSTTVLAPTAAEADALATAFFVMTTDEVEAYCDRNRAISAILISGVGKTSSEVNVTTINVEEDRLKILAERA